MVRMSEPVQDSRLLKSPRRRPYLEPLKAHWPAEPVTKGYYEDWRRSEAQVLEILDELALSLKIFRVRGVAGVQQARQPGAR